jgi:putative ABC transport system ATP-binding protein
MIRLENIRRYFSWEGVETRALDTVNLDVARGEFLAIMGPSGCGKSTLLNILGTLDRPSDGHYMFEGDDLVLLKDATLAQFRSATVGFVFQNFNLIDELTIQENVELGLVYRRSSVANRRGLAVAAMDRVGISHRARHFPYQLSGGQQQRVAIARAIAGHPRLILADEPTGNLDTENGGQVMNILASLNAEGATIVMVTHSPAHADVAHRRIDMIDGRIVSSVARAL